jgi:hypothetical protein
VWPFLKECAYYAFGRLGGPYARRHARRVRAVVADKIEDVKALGHEYLVELRNVHYVIAIVLIAFLLLLVVPLPPQTMTWARFAANVHALWASPWFIGWAVVASILCAVLIAFVYVFGRIDELDDLHARERKQAGHCEPDGEPHNAAVFLRGATAFDRENFLNEFRSIPKEANEIVLVLRQTRRPSWFRGTPYTFDSMRRQIEARQEALRMARAKAEKKSTPFVEPAVAWVCFVTKHNTVEAYQPYSRFEDDILKCGNQTYVDLINDGNVYSFRDRVIKLMDESKSCVMGPKPVRALGNNFLPANLTGKERLTRKQALAWLVRLRKSEAMLVTNERKRLGMVTIYSLVDQLEGDFLPAEQPLAGRVEARLSEIADRVRELEEGDPIPTPPDYTADDDPVYDTMVPYSGGDEREPPGPTPP